MDSRNPLTESDGPHLEPISAHQPLPTPPNPLDQFVVEIDPNWFISRDALSKGLDSIKENYDKFACTHRESEIHSIKTVIANKLVEALNAKFPDNTLHAFEAYPDNSVLAGLIKQHLLQTALGHELFKPRRWVALHDTVNNTAHYVNHFFTPADQVPPVNPLLPTGCQSVLQTALRTEKHKFRTEMHKRENERAEYRTNNGLRR